MTQKYEPVKKMKMYRLSADCILNSLAEEGNASDMAVYAIERLKNGKREYTAAHTFDDAYNNFCEAAQVPSWYQPELKSILSEFQDICVFETGKEANSYGAMITRIITCAANQEMNRLPGESVADARKRIGKRMRTEVYRTPSGNLRKEKIKTDYDRAMSMLNSEPASMGTLF